MTETSSLADLLRVDQRARWQLGDPVQVEAYLLLHPALQAEPEAVLELIWNELVLRQEQGDKPQLLEYLRRFGEFEERLPGLFDVLYSLETASKTVADSKPAPRLSSETASLPVGNIGESRTVFGYEIVAELGRGGMGVVYQARQSNLKRTVALKMILAGLDSDPTVLARFRTEAEAVARLQHPNIVQIYEVGEHEGRPFLSLEFVDGGSLRQKIDAAPLSEREAAQLVETLARAVHHTHQRGILHRDLNPNNVLLMADGTPKISDFGLARLMDAESRMTRTEAFLGTPHYMAPEQAAGHTKQVGPAADVYSLGAILYELMTRYPPFMGGTVFDTLEKVRTELPLPPRRLRASLAPDLETICLKCLEKAPHQRYASAEALADDLRCFLDGKSIRARPVPRWRLLARSARRHPRLVAATLGALLLLGLLLTSWSNFRAKEQLASRRLEENYQQFLRRRNDAHFYGLLSGAQSAQFLGNEAGDNWKAAESAIGDALAFAGISVESGAPINPDVTTARKAEVVEECFSLLLMLAEVREQQGEAQRNPKEQYQEALQILERARQFGFQTRAYHLRRAHLLEQLGEPEQARTERTQAAALPLQGALDYFLLGEEQFRRGDWDEAAASFDRAAAIQPDHFWAQFFVALSHLGASHYEIAKARLTACLNLRRDFVWAYLFRSFANERLQAWSEAEADFQHALELDPNDDARYVLFLTRGIMHYNQSALEQAASDFREALALRPAQYNAHLNLAQVYLARNQFAEAEEEMKRALQLKPPVAVVFAYHLERGRQLLRMTKYEEAIRACSAALELSPERPEPYEVDGRACLALGRFEQAEQSYADFLQRGGKTGPDFYRGRGTARMRLGKYPEAAEDYSRALELSPDGDLYQHRGWALFFADAWKLAERDFSRAIEMDHDAGDAYTGRGLARVMLGRYSEAVADADRALRLQPGSPEMMHNLACVFAQAAVRAEGAKEERDRQALANDYRRRAVDSVRRTLKMLRPEERRAFWREKILPDEALAPLRNDPRFMKLQDELVQP